MKKYIYTLLLIQFWFFACNKVTYVEGLNTNPISKVIVLNDTVDYKKNSSLLTKATLYFQIDSTNFETTIDINKDILRGSTKYKGFDISDTIIEIGFGSSSLLFSLVRNKDNSNTSYIKKYEIGEEIDSSEIQSANVASPRKNLIFAFKRNGKDTTWKSVDSVYSGWYNNFYKFNLNEKGIFGFKVYTNMAAYFGWVEITFYENKAILHRIGYQNFPFIKAGN